MNNSTHPSDPPLALVTGAAHRLGREIALGLARAGYAIGLHYHRSQSRAQRTAEELTNETGQPVYLLPADLTVPDAIEQLFTDVERLPHPLHVLVNSAGVMTRGRVDELSVAEWDTTLALNLRAPWLCAKAAAARMTHGGVIVNISDAGAGRAWTGFAAYNVSKAGLDALTRILARSFAPRVRVAAVAPGLVLPAADMTSEQWDHLVRRLPLQKPAAVRSVVNAVLFIVQNEDVTGSTLVIDDGYQLA